MHAPADRPSLSRYWEVCRDGLASLEQAQQLVEHLARALRRSIDLELRQGRWYFQEPDIDALHAQRTLEWKARQGYVEGDADWDLAWAEVRSEPGAGRAFR